MTYPGYDEPNYTQTPNALFDEHLRDMGDAELRVVLCAVRKTFGYHKAEDGISLTQFQRMTGLSRQGVIDGIDAATQRGLLFQVGTGRRGVGVYALRIVATGLASGLVKPVDQSTTLTRSSQASRPDLVKPVDTQKKLTKEKKQNKGSASTAVDSSKTTAPENGSNELPDALTLYEQNIGLRTPIIDQELTDLFDDYGGEWLCGAIRYAVTSEKRSLGYVIGTLAGWKRDGRGAKVGSGRAGAGGSRNGAGSGTKQSGFNELIDADGKPLFQE